ncbi:MAG: methylmalonyl Co-A mutase-associated GTPase MeaB [Phycisphaerales bacterium]|nr:methylmalonyl Co-A mutase-associated GTPase MeaB [Phycisphaerales bacterium]
MNVSGRTHDSAGGGPKRPALDEYVQGVLAGDRTILGRAITLVESSSAAHQESAQELLTQLMPRTGGALRLGVTGVPGVGKSTFIDVLGATLTTAGHRVAVLAVDPSSEITGGSILGDKTRMSRLGVDDNAFIRPSPSAGVLGGVARKTREAMLLCEAAGFDIVIVETVGVGQSETVVADMTDLFLVLMLPGAGDELQGMKRGLMELADIIAVNKADGENTQAAELAAREYEGAMRLMHEHDTDWAVPVLTCSALANTGIDNLWRRIADRHQELRESGLLEEKRCGQTLRWMRVLLDEHLRLAVRSHPAVRGMWDQIEQDVANGRIPAAAGAKLILDAFAGTT